MRAIRFDSLLLALTMAAAMFLSSCGSMHTPMRAHHGGGGGSSTTFTIPDGADEPTRRLLTEARSWLGTTYKYGGEDASGVDCSGFVMSVFDRSLSIKLPRNSAKQQQYCRNIDKKELSAGDLVFFTTRGSKGVGHVGLYIGEGRMIHSSSSRGVIVSSLDQPYYLDNYYSSGRVERFYALKSRSKKPAGKPSSPVRSEILLAGSEQPEEKATDKKRRSVHFEPAVPPPATAASMERDKQKALNALLSQIEDSIYSAK